MVKQKGEHASAIFSYIIDYRCKCQYLDLILPGKYCRPTFDLFKGIKLSLMNSGKVSFSG
jgi:hypothetical protein